MPSQSLSSRSLVLLASLLCVGILSHAVGAAPSRPEPPDVPLLDQDGRSVKFRSEVLGEKVVAISFVFTTCGGICPVLGSTFSKLQERLGDRLGKEVSLITISIDPATDTPARLKEWGAQFGARPGWTLLTGDPGNIAAVLKALDAENHGAPMVLLANVKTGEWIRSYEDLTAPDKLYSQLMGLTQKVSAAQAYFGNTVLVDQDGTKLKLYDDLLKEKIVVVNAFFSSCQGVCSVLQPRMAELQALAGDRLGKDVCFLSISVDPLTDTPARLKTYAEDLHAKAGWHFLTGDREAVGEVLRKFGEQVDVKEEHSNLLLMGNGRTGLWKKVFGLTSPAELAAAFRSVLDDRGEAQP